MAKVTKKTEVKYSIEVSETEAIILSSVLYRIAGHPETTYRKHTQAIQNALYDAGISPISDIQLNVWKNHHHQSKLPIPIEGSIEFTVVDDPDDVPQNFLYRKKGSHLWNV